LGKQEDEIDSANELHLENLALEHLKPAYGGRNSDKAHWIIDAAMQERSSTSHLSSLTSHPPCSFMRSDSGLRFPALAGWPMQAKGKHGISGAAY
jgi:hypothetical protein